MKIIVVGALPQSLVNFRGPLLRKMVACGHEVFACASGADTEVIRQLDAWGVAYRNVPIKRAGMNPLQDMATFWRLFRLFREVKPDVVLAYTIKPVVWGLLAARLAGVNDRFAMVTGLGYAFMNGGSARQWVVQCIAVVLYRTALHKARAVFFQNPDDRAKFQHCGLLSMVGSIVQINGSGVDLAQFSPQPLPDEPVFLLIARLIADKGIREYRQAAHRVRQQCPQARFLLVGGLDDNPTSIDQIELDEWQASGDIEYLGALADVRPALAACSVYVLPSYREGMPRTVLEAMATGRPIITTDAPGCRETVTDDVNGLLVSPKNVQALAAAMLNLLEHPGLRKTMAAQSLRIAREKYDVHKVNEVILGVIGL